MTVKLQRGRLAWLALTIVLMVVACGSGATDSAPTPETPTPPPAPTATVAPAFPTGTLAKSSYTWEFKADGTWILRLHLKGVEEIGSGTYTVTGDQLAIQDAIHSCKGTLGTYAWTYDGEVLTLTEVEDKCRNRAGVAWGRWRKNP
jgi:hypothetical protein